MGGPTQARSLFFLGGPTQKKKKTKIQPQIVVEALVQSEVDFIKDR
jgi:hypothetical protein